MRELVETMFRDRRGSIAVTSALLFTTVIGFAALGVDAGSVYTDRRKAQSTADLAAIAAVSNLASAEKAAAVTTAQNNLPEASYSLDYGIYTADPAIEPAQRFTLSSPDAANAARVTVKMQTPLFFGKLLTGQESFPVRAMATATQSAFASFSIGSRLMRVDDGLFNEVLSKLLISRISLSVMDYEALADMKLEFFGFMNALAERVHVTAGSYSSLLVSNVKVRDVLKAMLDTGRLQHGSSTPAVRAMTSLAQSVQGSMQRVRGSALVDLGPYGSMQIGQRPKTEIYMSAFDMVSAVGQIANGDHQFEFDIATSIPGINGASLKIAIGERPKGTSWVAVGTSGASVYTAQTRLLLTVRLASVAPFSVVTVPIYIDVASSMAKLAALKCGFPNIATSTATLDVKPGIADTWIGEVSNSQFTNLSSAPSPLPAALAEMGGTKVTARAHVYAGNMSATPVVFSYSDIQQQVRKAAGTTDFSASLLSRLIGDMTLSVSGSGFGIAAPGMSSGVASVVNNAAVPVDRLASSLLQVLGVGVGQADVWVSGIRCDGAVLVI